ncbi:hypothetical protein VTN96DRAFT_2647 [Rasamsonia emersonii]
MRFFTASLSTALAALASAYTQPDYSKPPTGNPIYTPGLNQQVPVGSPFEITWQPTTPGTVSLVLLRGPSTNVVPLYAIAENIPNTGKFSWTPSTQLQNDVTHYGLLLVDDATGQYQYSTQFGIKNPGSGAAPSATTVDVEETTTICPETESPTAAPTPSETTVEIEETTTFCPESATATPSPQPVVTTPSSSAVSTPAVTATLTPATPTPSATTVEIEETTTFCPESETATASRGVYPVGTGNASVPIVSPTKTPYVPTTLRPVVTGTGSAVPPKFTGAADRNMVSFGGVAAVAGVAALLAF